MGVGLIVGGEVSDEGAIETQGEADSEAELIGEGESPWPCETPTWR